MPPETPSVTEPNSAVTAIAADATTAVATDAKPDTAAPSAAGDTGAKQPASLLDAVRGAVDKKPADASPAATERKEVADATAPTGDKPADATADDDKPPPFHEHPAWKRQLAKTAERDETIKGLTPKAQAYDAMTSMVATAGLSKEEVDTGFNIMSLMKNDPAKAYEQLRPFMESLETYLGVKLPADLKQRVDQGFITEDDARREARTRADAATATTRATRTEAARTEDSQRATSDAMQGAVSKWETDWQKSDPDYARKQPFVTAEIHALRALHGAPADASQALILVETARKNVNERMKGLVAPKPSIAPPVTSTSSVRATTAPTTLREAAEAGLRAARAA